MRHIGFTGTRHGMSGLQASRVADMLMDQNWDAMFHHGDCVGADAEAHLIALRFAHRVTIHPPTDQTHRAFCTGYTAMNAALSHMKRNKVIVAESDVMIATPLEMEEQTKGGTWKTIGFARKAGKPLAIVWRDGTVTKERWT